MGRQQLREMSRADSSIRNQQHQLLRSVADVGTFALIVLAPLFMGGRHPAGRFIFASLICVIALAWVWSQQQRRHRVWSLTGLEWLMLASGCVALFQLVPLPHSWFAALSPAVSRRLPLWSATGTTNLELGSWSCLSVHPDATRRGLALFVAYALLFVVTAQRMSNLSAVRRTLRWVATAALLMALIGLAQFVTGSERFLWLYTHPTRHAAGVVRGAFANQNHLAHLLALGVGPLVWWLSSLAPRAGHDGSRGGRAIRWLRVWQWQRVTLSMGLGLVLLAGLLTFSRAGVCAMLLATLFVAIVLMVTGRLSRQGWAVGVVVVLLLLVALTVYGHDRLASRMRSLVGTQSLSDVSAGRDVIWSAVLRAAESSPVLGTGVGTHRDIYPVFLDQFENVEYTHAESGYLQVLEEMGVVGLSLLLVAIGVIGNWCRQALLAAPNQEARVLAGAVTASLLVSVLHSLVDFVWYIPACMAVTVILAACAWRLSRLTPGGAPSRQWVRVPRPLFLAGSFGVCVAALMIVTLNWGPARAARHWDEFTRLTKVAAAASVPGDLLDSESAEADIDEMVCCVAGILNANPRDARAHARMAALCLQKFDVAQRRAKNAMNLTEVRDAALMSDFSSLQAQSQWLARALPENRHLLDDALSHARTAARLSPLQGEAYVYLAQLGFLTGDGRRAKWACLDQAMRVRPNSDDVLMAIGSELALAGDLPQATICWRRVFQRNPVYQQQIIAMFAPQVSAQTFLAAFQPDADGARSLFQRYRKMGFIPQATVAGRYYLGQLAAGTQGPENESSADQCLEAFAVQDYLGDDSAALASLRQAARLTPSRYAVRQKLARCLLRQHAYSEAREHLQWCLRRKPDDAALQRDLQVAMRAEVAPLLR